METVTLIVDSLEALVLLVSTLHLFRHSDASERRSPVVFLGFSYAVLAVSNLYWIAHELMTRESIYDFSAIDIASAGFFLLAGASVAMLFGERDHIDVPLLAGSCAFVLVQGALWMMWTGDWFKDSIGALPVWYLSYYVFRALRRSQVLTRPERIAFVAVSVAIAAMQVWSFAAQETYGGLVDAASGIVCLLVFAWLAAKLALRWQSDGAASAPTVALAFVTMLWALSSMYLMYEPLYTVFLALSVAMMAICAVVVVRRVEEA